MQFVDAITTPTARRALGLDLWIPFQMRAQMTDIVIVRVKTIYIEWAFQRVSTRFLPDPFSIIYNVSNIANE